MTNIIANAIMLVVVLLVLQRALSLQKKALIREQEILEKEQENMRRHAQALAKAVERGEKNHDVAEQALGIGRDSLEQSKRTNELLENILKQLSRTD